VVVHGPRLQSDSFNCGVLVGMVMWLTEVYDRPPTLAKIKSNCCFTRNEMSSFRRWMALSALADRIWLPPSACFMARPTYAFANKERRCCDCMDGRR
jgi:hypothetical protein